MWYTRLMLPMLATLCLCGCSLSRPATERHSYLLQPAPGAVAPAPLATTVRIASVTVAPAFEGKNFIYRTGEHEFEADYYHEFFIAPRAMITSFLLNWLRSRGLFSEVYAPGSGRRADVLLDGHVSAFYGDFRIPSAAAAMVEMRVSLSSPGEGGEPVRLLTRTLAERVPLTETSAEALAVAYDTALGRLMQQLEQELLAQVQTAEGRH